MERYVILFHINMIIVDNEFLPQAMALIDSAKKSVDVSTFKAEITHKPRGKRLIAFFNKLYEKKSQGLRVRFMINFHDDRRVMPKTNLCAINNLKNHKIEVRSLSHNRCNHAKLLIVDTDKAIVGSHNLSVKSCHNNFEVSCIVVDPVLVCYLQAVYDRVFLKAVIPA